MDRNSAKIESAKRRPLRNRWSQRPKARAWPLATDLGRGIGSRRWWLALAGLCAGIAAGLAIALISPADLLGGSADGEAAAAEDTLAKSVAKPVPRAAQRAGPHALVLRPILLEPGLPVDVPSTEEPRLRRDRVTVRRGDTLMRAVLRTGADRREAYAAIEALRAHFEPRRLKAGQALRVEFAEGEDGARLARLALRKGFDARVAAERTGEGAFRARRETLETTPILAYASGTIQKSLYLSARRAGLPKATILELIRLYSFSVDFQRQIRPGDRFEVMYEREVAALDGRVDEGGVVYAELTLQGEELALYRFQPPDEDGLEYFNAAGESVRKALMKTPLDGARITSRFGPRRHPIQGYVRDHQGVDFGAPPGTPVYAAGDGVVERASRYGGYGNYIRIRHNATEFQTAYAHLSGYARGVSAGARVEQGEVIGYVGATGQVTGPHLHYEIYRGGERVNPLGLDLPSGRVLDGAPLEAFQEVRARLDSDRQTLARARRLAEQADERVETAGRQASAGR